MYLRKDQIQSVFSLLGPDKASDVLHGLFESYRRHLDSADVADLYGAEYFEALEGHPIHRVILNEFKINIRTRYAFEYMEKHLKKGDRVLDVGCGTGDFSFAVATLGAEKVIGVDFSESAIASAKQKQGSRFSNCEFLKDDVARIRFDHQFDFIVLNDLTEHLSDRELSVLFPRLRELMSDRGQVLIHTPNGLALCNDTDTDWVQKAYILYQRMRWGWKGMVRTPQQIYFDQVHINIKSFRQISAFLKSFGFRCRVLYDEKFRVSILNKLSTNMLVIAEKDD